MNAIISLCHFCELHGPRILFCTQPIRQQEPRTDVETEDSEASFPRRVKSPSLSTDAHATPSLPSMKNDMCEGCYSIQPGYVSHDEDAQVSYVSTQQPHHPQVFSRIRQACIRSLSCEVCPGREGPIFFGDEHYGYVLSYTFYIEDAQARGLQRWYSILVMMMDKIYLLNSWPFLVPHLKTVIENLQSRAHKVYTDEQTKCPPVSFRLNPSINPANFIHHRGGNKPARSLVELTGHKNVFKVLHFSFIWILKACGNRVTETLLEGPPTEDSIIDMEKQEETEEGFIKLYTISKDPAEQVASEDEGCVGSDTEQDGVSKAPIIKNLRQLRKILGNNKFHTLAHHVIIGNQVIVSGAQRPLIKSILSALKMLLPKGCCRSISYSNTYEESWRCNFLGLALNVSLPKHTMSTEMFILLEILDGIPSQEATPNSSLESDRSLSDNDFANYSYKLSSPVTLPDKGPTVLNKMEPALRNENLSEEVVEQCFICLKEEWMNKVKVLFKFTKAGGGRSKEDTEKLLKVVGAQEEDKQLLKFWMTGLSVQYRTHILSSSKSQH